MKSSAHKALAALQHKYHRKICQLGQAYRKQESMEERIDYLTSRVKELKGALHDGQLVDLTGKDVKFNPDPWATSKRAADRLIIERLEFDLRTAEAIIKQLYDQRSVSHSQYDSVCKLKVQAENRAQAAKLDAEKWENRATFAAAAAICFLSALVVLGYKYSAITGLL